MAPIDKFVVYYKKLNISIILKRTCTAITKKYTWQCVLRHFMTLCSLFLFIIASEDLRVTTSSHETDGKADLRTRSGNASEHLFYFKPFKPICSQKFNKYLLLYKKPTEFITDLWLSRTSFLTMLVRSAGSESSESPRFLLECLLELVNPSRLRMQAGRLV